MRTGETSPAAAARAILIRVCHAEARLGELSDGEWDLAIRVVRRARMLAWLGERVRSQGLIGRIPPRAWNHMQGAIAVADKRAQLTAWELDRVAWAVGGMDIPLVVLKGCAYRLAGLPNAPGRLFADVDLLLPEARLAQAERALRDRGWRFNKLTPYDQHYYRAWTHELPPLVHPEREVEIDLHHNILPRTSRLHPDAKLLLANARTIPGTQFEVLAPEDMALHTITHLFYDSDLADAFRDLVDVDRLLRHFAQGDAEFWTRLVERARELDLGRPAFYGLHFACCLLGTPVPASALEAVRRPGAPPRAIGSVMDWLTPRALFPHHPDATSGPLVSLARWLLYVRSHWIRMPPLLLARHLGYKFYVRRVSTRIGRLRGTVRS